jgi:hypothetical protein
MTPDADQTTISHQATPPGPPMRRRWEDPKLTHESLPATAAIKAAAQAETTIGTLIGPGS